MSPHVGQQRLNPVVGSTTSRAAGESQGFERWRCARTVAAGMTDPSTGNLFFPLLELSLEDVPLIQVLPWWLAVAQRTSFVL